MAIFIFNNHVSSIMDFFLAFFSFFAFPFLPFFCFFIDIEAEMRDENDEVPV